MDHQNRVKSKPGSGGMSSTSLANMERRERLRQLALQTIDLSNDPYLLKNHLGSYECRLCLTLHSNEGSYLAHTQGKKHQANLMRRAMKEARESGTALPHGFLASASKASAAASMPQKKNIIRIGRPGYKVTKVQDPESKALGLLFQVHYPDVTMSFQIPKHRFMSAYEQHVEPANRAYQYVVFAAEPYETIAFRVSAKEIERDSVQSLWDPNQRIYILQFMFKREKELHDKMED